MLAWLAVMGAIAPALAGGIEYGGIVRQRVPAAVPVPAPAPVPEIASGYYLRLDAAYSMSDTDKYRAQSPNNDDAVRSDGGLEQFGRFGFGVGYHFRPWLRMDATFDVRTDVSSRANSGVTSTANSGSSGALLTETFSDHFRSKNWTGLVNAYIDMPMWRSFTPYVGAGVGLVLHTIDGRNFTRTATCVDPVPANCTAANNAGLIGTFSGSSGSDSDVAFAAAFMAGFSYQVSDSGSIDFGYRLLHLQGTSFKTSLNAGDPSIIKIPSQNNHEIRIGYRVDIN
ncbi:MAG: outer membrane beta-barrel protein [Hyphomicrobiaceae bacterium]